MRTTIFILFFLLVVPSVFAENGCFFYQESPFHCTDIDRQQAQEECSLYSGCLLSSTFVSGNKCSSYLDCQVGSAGELVNFDRNQSSSVVWLLAAAILFAAACYYAFKAGILRKVSSWFKKPQMEPIKKLPTIWEYLSPFNSSLNTKYRLRKAKSEHGHKLNQQKRKEFFTHLGLALPEKNYDNFSKLSSAYRFYEKHKQKMSNHLSKQELKLFQNLEQVAEKSRQKNTFNPQKKQTRKEVQSILNELREISEKK